MMDENYMYQYDYNNKGYNYENPEFSIDNLPGRSNYNPTKQNYAYNQFSSTYNPNHNRKIKTPFNGNQLPPNKNNFLQKTQTKEEVPKFENHDFPALGKTANKTKKDVPNLKNEDFPSLTKSSNNNPNNNTNNNNSNNNLLIDNNSHNNLVIDNNQKNQLDYNSENSPSSSFQNPQIFDDPNQYNDMMHSNPETAFYYQMQQQQMQQQYQQEQMYEYQQQQMHQQQLHQQQHQINPNNKNNNNNVRNNNSSDIDNDEKFCLIELQPVIRMTNPDLNLLSVGQDLTILGLELNSRECLYETFISPWFNESSKNVPSFLINDHIIIAPPSKKLDLFTDETLFYMFYTHTNDSLQLQVSRELHKRKWRYHKFLQSWIRGGSNENEKTDSYEKGTFEFFDTNAWEKISKENFVIENSAIEEIPPSDL
eukprot:TRINITY_DN6865_c0_g1_i2.p1 TRINITY_DN6865_c0_g1~~TRINITY_DN6865_c0_g1_i2.p1  ORF type:complete len:423 (+),score=116.02 TRINITY_DN6865_c0_g1_i2:5-1273(+)